MGYHDGPTRWANTKALTPGPRAIWPHANMALAPCGPGPYGPDPLWSQLPVAPSPQGILYLGFLGILGIDHTIGHSICVFDKLQDIKFRQNA